MIHYQFVFEKRYFSDLDEASNWYEKQETGLGKQFRQEVINALEEIYSFPKFNIRYKNIRCKLINKFPYMIHYHIDPDASIVYILALISTHKNPNTSWLK